VKCIAPYFIDLILISDKVGKNYTLGDSDGVISEFIVMESLRNSIRWVIVMELLVIALEAFTLLVQIHRRK